MSGTRTEFAETAALMAVLDEDDDRLDDLLAGMLPGELQALAAACDTLAYFARRYARITRREKAQDEPTSAPATASNS